MQDIEVLFSANTPIGAMQATVATGCDPHRLGPAQIREDRAVQPLDLRSFGRTTSTPTAALPYQVRTPEQVRGVFNGLDLVEPGVVPVTLWRPDTAHPDPDIDGYGGVGLLPCAQQHP